MFRVVPDIHGKDWMTLPHNPVAACDSDSKDASFDKRFEYGQQAMIEDVCNDTVMCSLVGNVLEMGGWEVCEEDLSTVGGLLTHVFQKIANGEIDRVGGLAPEDHQLCLVRGDNNRDNSCSRFSLLEFLLQ